MTGTASPVTAIAIGICTYHRPEALRALLGTITHMIANERIDASVAVVVVDDSPEADARAIVEAFGVEASRVEARGVLDVVYANSASSNISVARNRALELAREVGEVVLCIDDDCIPRPGWITELVAAATVTGADIVVGHRQFVAPAGAPQWLRDEPFLQENELYDDLSEPAVGNTANVLIRSRWLAESGVRFRDSLGKTGSEDMVFLADAADAGAVVRFSAKSVVDEPCATERTTLGYHLWRQFWLGNGEAQINRTLRTLSPPRMLLRGARRVARGLVHTPVCLVRHRTAQWRWALALTASGVGLLAGVAGIRLKHHS